MKLRKMAKIKKRYNQAPHLTQDTTGEGNKHFLQILVLGLLYNTIQAKTFSGCSLAVSVLAWGVYGFVWFLWSVVLV